MECKYGHCKYDCRQQNELIDTLWNVNTLATTENYLAMGINRYIMECKFNQLQGMATQFQNRINRYIMECK